ncbi:MAG: hypothetical protein KC478_01165 [Bacteriovoracaceae bacterium]|nr:hypothetical protein [Bacteriovoracaceae bacterium]
MKISKSVPIIHSHDIYTTENDEYDEVVLLLHGFQLNGYFMFKRFEKRFGPKVKVIAPNAPFIVPLKKDQGWEARYGWYFYDSDTRNFYINYDPAANWLSELLKDLNSNNSPVTIIGYSQGGYIAPKVAELVPEVKKVVGINCIFRSERFKIKKNTTYSQVHGNEDTLVAFTEARSEFLRLKELGVEGEFIEVCEDHFLNGNLIKATMDLV